MKTNNLYIENTRFIFNTNFSGDPKRDKYGSSERKGNIVIPNSVEIIGSGFNERNRWISLS